MQSITFATTSFHHFFTSRYAPFKEAILRIVDSVKIFFIHICSQLASLTDCCYCELPSLSTKNGDIRKQLASYQELSPLKNDIPFESQILTLAETVLTPSELYNIEEMTPEGIRFYFLLFIRAMIFREKPLEFNANQNEHIDELQGAIDTDDPFVQRRNQLPDPTKFAGYFNRNKLSESLLKLQLDFWHLSEKDKQVIIDHFDAEISSGAEGNVTLKQKNEAVSEGPSEEDYRQASQEAMTQLNEHFNRRLQDLSGEEILHISHEIIHEIIWSGQQTKANFPFQLFWLNLCTIEQYLRFNRNKGPRAKKIASSPLSREGESVYRTIQKLAGQLSNGNQDAHTACQAAIERRNPQSHAIRSLYTARMR